jgi:hypothetical protein
MSSSYLTVQQARDVAAWLKEQGEHKRANDVLAIIRSFENAQGMNRVLHRDNMELRAGQMRAQQDRPKMMQEAVVVPLADLRAATEDDVVRALDGAYCQPHCSPAELLELFNRMLDVLVGEDDD